MALRGQTKDGSRGSICTESRIWGLRGWVMGGGARTAQGRSTGLNQFQFHHQWVLRSYPPSCIKITRTQVDSLRGLIPVWGLMAHLHSGALEAPSPFFFHRNRCIYLGLSPQPTSDHAHGEALPRRKVKVSPQVDCCWQGGLAQYRTRFRKPV